MHFTCFIGLATFGLAAATPLLTAKSDIIERDNAEILPRDVWSCQSLGYANGLQRTAIAYVPGTSNKYWAAVDACFASEYKAKVRVKLHQEVTGGGDITGQYFVHGKGEVEEYKPALILPSERVDEDKTKFLEWDRPWGGEKRILSVSVRVCIPPYNKVSSCWNKTVKNPKV